MTTTRWSALAVSLALSACAKSTVVTEEPAPQRRASADAAADAGAALARPVEKSDAGAAPSRFRLAATGSEMVLFRPTGSPVVLVESTSNAAWILGRDGSVRLVEALAAVEPGAGGIPLRVGRVAGRHPELVFEVGMFMGRGGSVVRNWRVDVEKNVARRFEASGGHVAVSGPWSSGIELGWVAEESSDMAPDLPKFGRFSSLAGPREARAVPRVPKNLEHSIFPGTVTSYASGEIFAVAIVQGGDLVRHRRLYELGSGTPKEIRFPGVPLRLVPGRSPSDLLVAGLDGAPDDQLIVAEDELPPMLARLDGTKVVPVRLPSKAPIRSLATSDDGVVWLVTGNTVDPRVAVGGQVWRATLPELAWESVTLPPDVVPVKIAATSGDDVWLAAFGRGGVGAGLLLHLDQAPAEPFEFPHDPDAVARLAIGKRTPAPFDARCTFPFLWLGATKDLAESDAVAVAREIDRETVVVRTPAGDEIFVVEDGPFSRSTEDAKERARWLAAARKRAPAAKLQCGRYPVVRTLPVKDAGAR